MEEKEKAIGLNSEDIHTDQKGRYFIDENGNKEYLLNTAPFDYNEILRKYEEEMHFLPGREGIPLIGGGVDYTTPISYDIAKDPVQQEDYLARQQSKWGLLGKSLVRGFSEATLGALEAIGYLGSADAWKGIAGKAGEDYETEFSRIFRELKEDLNEAAGPIYRTIRSQSDDLWHAMGDATFWAGNAESVFSTLQLMMPALGVGKLLTGIGKLAKLGTAGKRFVRTIGSAFTSRFMESSMEAKEKFDSFIASHSNDSKYKNDINQLRLDAGKVAASTMQLNMLLVATDFLQFDEIIRGWTAFKNANKFYKKAANLVGGTLITSALEAGEEGVQYLIGKESEFNVLDDESKKLMGETFSERWDKYTDDIEFKTSLLLGAIGGGFFSAIGPLADKTQNVLTKRVFGNFAEHFGKYRKAKEEAVDSNNEKAFDILNEQEFENQVSRHVSNNTLDELIKIYEDNLDSLDEEEKAAAQDKINTIKTLQTDLQELSQFPGFKDNLKDATFFSLVKQDQAKQNALNKALNSQLETEISSMNIEGQDTKDIALELKLGAYKRVMDNLDSLKRINEVEKGKIKEAYKQYLDNLKSQIQGKVNYQDIVSKNPTLEEIAYKEEQNVVETLISNKIIEKLNEIKNNKPTTEEVKSEFKKTETKSESKPEVKKTETKKKDDIEQPEGNVVEEEIVPEEPEQQIRIPEQKQEEQKVSEQQKVPTSKEPEASTEQDEADKKASNESAPEKDVEETKIQKDDEEFDIEEEISTGLGRQDKEAPISAETDQQIQAAQIEGLADNIFNDVSNIDSFPSYYTAREQAKQASARNKLSQQVFDKLYKNEDRLLKDMDLNNPSSQQANALAARFSDLVRDGALGAVLKDALVNKVPIDESFLGDYIGAYNSMLKAIKGLQSSKQYGDVKPAPQIPDNAPVEEDNSQQSDDIEMEYNQTDPLRIVSFKYSYEVYTDSKGQKRVKTIPQTKQDSVKYNSYISFDETIKPEVGKVGSKIFFGIPEEFLQYQHNASEADILIYDENGNGISWLRRENTAKKWGASSEELSTLNKQRALLYSKATSYQGEPVLINGKRVIPCNVSSNITSKSYGVITHDGDNYYSVKEALQTNNLDDIVLGVVIGNEVGGYNFHIPSVSLEDKHIPPADKFRTGHLYAMVRSANGDYFPLRLYTQKYSTLQKGTKLYNYYKNHMNEAFKKILSSDAKTSEQGSYELAKYVVLRLVKNNDSAKPFKIQTYRDHKYEDTGETLTREEAIERVKNSLINIPYNLLNSKNPVMTELLNSDALQMNIFPGEPFHSPTFGFDQNLIDLKETKPTIEEVKEPTKETKTEEPIVKEEITDPVEKSFEQNTTPEAVKELPSEPPKKRGPLANPRSKLSMALKGKNFVKPDLSRRAEWGKDMGKYSLSNLTKEEAEILEKAPRDSNGNLLAPNGKSSNLTIKQYAQVRTKAFKDWFGDWINPYKSNITIPLEIDRESVDADGFGAMVAINLGDEVIGTIPMQQQITSPKDFKFTKYVDVNGVAGASEIFEEYRGQGYGKAAYWELGMWLSRNGSVLRSAKDSSRTEAATRVWKSLERDGFAKKVDNRYEFVNNASKVVDENGEPLVVYHSTPYKFNGKFDFDYKLKNGSEFTEPFIHLGSKETASAIKGKPLAFFLNLRNPLITPDNVHETVSDMLRELYNQDLISRDEYASLRGISNSELRELMLNLGYDGTKYENEIEGGGTSYSFVREDQAKLVQEEIDNESKFKLIDSESRQTWNQEKELAWLKKNLPQLADNDLVKIHKGLINVGNLYAWGRFKDGIITLSDMAAEGTAFHEAFHAVFSMYLTESEANSILKKARKEFKLEGKSDLAVEEFLADKFRDYVETDQIENRSVLEKISDFFKNIYYMIKEKLHLNPTIEQVFYNTNRGRYAKKKFEKNRPLVERNWLSNITPSVYKRRVDMLVDIFEDMIDNLANEYPELSRAEVIKQYSLSDWILEIHDQLYASAHGEDAIYTDPEQIEAIDLITDELVEFDADLNPKFGQLALDMLKEISGLEGITFRATQIVDMDMNKQDETEEFMNNEETNKQEGWQIDQMLVSPVTKLRQSTRNIIRRIPKADANGNLLAPDDLGYTVYMSGTEVFATMLNKLSSMNKPSDLMKTLESLKTNFPWVGSIIDILKANPQVKVDFYNSFRNDSVEYMIINTQSDGTARVFAGNALNTMDEVLKVWSTNYSMLEHNREGYVDSLTDMAAKIRKIYEPIPQDRFRKFITKQWLSNWKSGTFSNPQVNGWAKIASEAMKLMGMDATPAELVKIFQSNLRLNDPRSNFEPAHDFLLKLYGSLNMFALTLKKPEFNVNGDVYSEIEKTSFYAKIKALAKAVADVRPSLHESSLREGGKTYSSNITPSFIQKLFKRLTDVTDRSAYDVFKKSFFYTNNKGEITHPWLSSLLDARTKDRASEIRVGIFLQKDKVKYSELSKPDFLASKINLWTNNNNRNYGYYMMPIPSDASSMPVIRFRKYEMREAVSGLTELAKAEIRRIDVYNKRKELIKEGRILGIKNFDATFKKGKVVEGRGAKFLMFPFLNQYSLEELKNSEEKLTQYIVEAVDKGFEAFKANPDLDLNKVDKRMQLEQNLKEFYYNDLMAQYSIMTMTSGDLAYYKNDVDFFKRNKQNMSPGQYGDWESLGIPEKFKAIRMKDNEMPSLVADAYYENLVKNGVSHTEAMIIAAKFGYSNAVDENGKKIVKLPNGKIIESGLNNSTDGQTFITLDRYRNVARMSSKWDDAKEKSYQNLKNGTFTKEDILTFSLQPIKPYMFAPHNVDSGVEIDGKPTALYQPLQNKNSEAVLIPQMVQNSPLLSALIKGMEQNGIEAVYFESSVKEGIEVNTPKEIKDKLRAQGKEVLPDAVLEFTGDPNELSEANLKHYYLSNDDYMYQMDTPEHFKDTLQLFGSQIRKHIIANLSKESEFVVWDKKLNGEQIARLYDNVISWIYDANFKKVEEKIGTVEGLAEQLQSSVMQRKLAENTTEAVQLMNYKGKKVFKLPLYFPLQSNRIFQMISSIFRNNIIRNKVSGGAFYQATSFGYDDALKVHMKDGHIEYVDCIVPYTYSKQLLELADENGLIDPDKVEDKELLKMICYRIPTEDKYSAVPLRIKGFCSPAEGGIIKLPSDILTITGSDLDKTTMSN